MTTRWFSDLSFLSSLIFAVLVGIVVPASGQSSAGPQQALGEGERRAPDFTLQRMNGETFQLSEHRGEIVVLNFWATWCPPCKQEIPGFITLQKEFREQGVTFVGVSLDEDGFSSVRPFAEKMGINYPLVVDDGSVAPKYGGVRVLPSTVLIGPNGNVQDRKRGYFPEEHLRVRLKTLLERTASES
jgi:peroxiredoxin